LAIYSLFTRNTPADDFWQFQSNSGTHLLFNPSMHQSED